VTVMAKVEIASDRDDTPETAGHNEDEQRVLLQTVGSMVRQFANYLSAWGQEDVTEDPFKVTSTKARSSEHGQFEVFCVFTCAHPMHSMVMLPFETRTLALIRRIQQRIARVANVDVARPFVRPISSTRMEIGFHVVVRS